MGRLDGKVAIVTGAGAGIGRGEALLLAQEGALVVVNDFMERPAQEVVEEIKAAGGEAAVHVGDVADEDSAAGMVKVALDTYHDLNIIVNNAGITRDSMLVTMTPGQWDDIMRVHLRGMFCTTREATIYWRQKFKEDGEKPVFGRVINTSSGTGLFTNVGQTNYAAAKAGIATFTIGAAQELAKYGVLVNAVAPNARTKLTEETPGLAELVKKPEDPDEFDVWHAHNVAPLVAWLASEQCQFGGGVFFQIGGSVSLCESWTVLEEGGDTRTELTLGGLDDLMPSLVSGREMPVSKGGDMTKLIVERMGLAQES